MYIVEGKPSAFQKKWIEDFPVKRRRAAGLERLAQHCGFQRIVPPQGGIAAADEDIVFSGCARRKVDRFRNLPMCGSRLRDGHAP